MAAHEEALKPYFEGASVLAELVAARTELHDANAIQETDYAERPLETQKVYEAKGQVLTLIERMNRLAKIAFDGDAGTIGLFNKDLILRAKRTRAAAAPPSYRPSSPPRPSATRGGSRSNRGTTAWDRQSPDSNWTESTQWTESSENYEAQRSDWRLASSSEAGRHRAAGVMMMPIPRSGVFRGVSGLDEARAVPGIESVTVGLQPGEAIRALPEGDKYLGFIFARGETPAEVEAALRASYTKLHFELSPLLEFIGTSGEHRCLNEPISSWTASWVKSPRILVRRSAGCRGAGGSRPVHARRSSLTASIIRGRVSRCIPWTPSGSCPRGFPSTHLPADPRCAKWRAGLVMMCASPSPPRARGASSRRASGPATS